MDFVQQIFAVLLVLGILCAGLWLLRRTGVGGGPLRSRNSSGISIEVLARQSLTPQHSVHVVQIGSVALVLSVSPSGCTCLDRMPMPKSSEVKGLER